MGTDAVSHQVLYRKYRPQTFDEVVGQKEVVRTLQQSIDNNAVAHAYLFSGGRGTGKTTIARLVANALGTSSKDIYEIDAASNRKIDNFRELNESVHTLPFDSTYKVYIIDEVHMLTKEAFNAFLKTLEEPPKHVIFILATTEVEKLPETIVSRCQSFVFVNPTRLELAKTLQRIAKKEGVTIADDAASLMGMLADGSFRDGIGVLQKVLAYTHADTITVQDIEKVTNVPKQEVVRQLLLAIHEGNIDTALSTISIAADAHTDFSVLQKMLIDQVRAVMLLRYSSSSSKLLEQHLTSDDMQILKDAAEASHSSINSKLLHALLDSYTKTANAYIPQLPLELALIDVLTK